MNRAAPLVLLDATMISAQRGGVGRYVDELAREAALAGDPLVVVCQERDVDIFRAANVDVVVAPSFVSSVPLRFVWEQVGLPGLARRLKAQVIHSPHYTFPFVTRAKRVVTVHDLTFWSHPDRHSLIKRIFFRFWIRCAAHLPAMVVVPSQATADEFHAVTGVDPSRVRVAHHGVDTEIFRPPTQAEVKRFATAHGVSAWIAFLGTIEPRKNVVPLIEGFRNATAHLAKRPALLLAGAPGWDHAVEGAIRDARAADCDVRHLGYLPLEELSALLGGALLVAYPSEGEGFGLPVLEALSCGAAVVTSRSLALPEVGGDAVKYTDTDAGSIGNALSELLTNTTAREALRRKAPKRAALFSWSACLSVHRNAWRDVVSVQK